MSRTRNRSVEPELYPRPDGTVYVCGEPAALPVPEGGPADVTVEAASIQVLKVGGGACARGVWLGARTQLLAPLLLLLLTVLRCTRLPGRGQLAGVLPGGRCCGG
jgi:hypothetical protein